MVDIQMLPARIVVMERERHLANPAIQVTRDVFDTDRIALALPLQELGQIAAP
jgi:hypothetical protein